LGRFFVFSGTGRPLGHFRVRASALAFWKANDEANVQTCIARLNQYCFPRLRPRDISTRPAIDEKYALLLRELERANTGGKWQVAIQDLRKAMAETRTRK
jgi:hypothetical protein